MQGRSNALKGSGPQRKKGRRSEDGPYLSQKTGRERHLSLFPTKRGALRPIPLDPSIKGIGTLLTVFI